MLPVLLAANAIAPLNKYLTKMQNMVIMYLTREPLVSAHLTAGKAIAKNSALSLQDEGAIFYASH